jgi:hypothetical protein
MRKKGPEGDENTNKEKDPLGKYFPRAVVLHFLHVCVRERGRAYWFTTLISNERGKVQTPKKLLQISRTCRRLRVLPDIRRYVV